MFSVGEGITGYFVAEKNHWTDGTAAIVGMSGDLGLLEGLGASYLAGFFNGDAQDQAIGATTLAGTVIGLGAGKWLSNQEKFTRGDALVARDVSILCAGVPVCILGTTEVDEGKAYTSVAMVGSLIGYGYGCHMVRDKHFTTGQGTLISVAGLAGGLAGLGLGFAIDPHGKSNGKVHLSGLAIGSTAGFLISYHAFGKSAHRSASSLEMKLSPDFVSASSTPTRPVPALKLSLTF
jgi:hypothetical protein